MMGTIADRWGGCRSAGPSMREQAMVLVRTIARDALGLGREKGTIVQDEGQGNHGNGVLGTCDVGSHARTCVTGLHP